MERFSKAFVVLATVGVLATGMWGWGQSQPPSAGKPAVVVTFQDGTTQVLELKQPIAKIASIQIKTVTAPSAQALQPYVGKWAGGPAFGTITLRSENGELVGTYEMADGRMRLVLSEDGKFASGHWWEANDPGAKGAITLTPTGSKLKIKWAYADGTEGTAVDAEKVL